MKKKSFYQYLREETIRRTIVEADLSSRLLQQEAIAQFGEFVVKTMNLDELLDESVRLVTQTLNVEMCKILQRLPGQEELLLKAGVGWKEGLVGNVTVGAGSESQAGYTLATDEPIIVEDLRTDTRFNGPKLLLDHQVVSGMSVIIRGKEAPWGVIGVHSPHQRIFSQYDAHFLSSIASLIASAIERFEVEENLRHSRDELSIILNGVTEGITAQTQDGSIIYANRAAAVTLGFDTEAELISTPLPEVMKKFDILDEAGNPFPPQGLPGRRVLQGEPEASAHLRFRIRETGEEHWAIANATPVRNPAGEVTLAVNIFRDVTDMVLAQQAQNLLANAGRLFAESLDPETTLTNLANLVAANLADWCVVHLISKDEEVRQLVVAHKDPARVESVYDLQRRYPPNRNADVGVMRVLRTGQPEFYPEIPDELLEATAQDAQHLALMRELELRSGMIVPLVARSRILGAMSLVWSDSGRKYNQAEVDLVQELASRAAIALENLSLYQESQALNAQLEERVEMRTRQLSTSNSLLLKEIDERKKAEAALRKSETLLQSLFESAPDATILVDKIGTIAQINRQAETVFGYKRDELIGKNIDLLLPERYRGVHSGHRGSYFNRLATRPMGAGLELSAVRKDGSEFPVDINLSPVFTEEGELVISAVRDITERKRLETELAETHRRLFEGVEAERRLLSQELHDGPIQDLYGAALTLESLRESLIAEQDQEDLDSCRETLQNVVQTLRGICGELRPPALAQFGLEKAIHSHLIKLQQSHPDLKIEPFLMEDGQILPERTRLALYRVYQNSIGNIVRHAQAKRVRVDFILDEKQITLRVEDDGRGFQLPGRWIELARAGHFGLIGMVERIEAVGGKISIQSAVGQGTTVQVDVPLHSSELAGVPQRDSA